MTDRRAPPSNKASARLGDVRHGFAPDKERVRDAASTAPLIDIAAQLVDDIKATAATEMMLLQARAALVGDGARRAAMWGAVAGGAVLIALLTIVFGAVLALVPHTGAVLATIIVGGVLLVIAAFAVWRARSGAADIRTAFTERGDDVHWDDKL